MRILHATSMLNLTGTNAGKALVLVSTVNLKTMSLELKVIENQGIRTHHRLEIDFDG